MCQCIQSRLYGCCCCIFDSLVSGTICVGGVTTLTTTALHYTGIIDDWKAIAIPSAITFGAIVGGVIRCVCKTRSRLNSGIPPSVKNTSVELETIKVTTTPVPPSNETKTTDKVADKVANPIVLDTIDPLYPVIAQDSGTKMKKIHNQWYQEHH